MGRRAAGRRGGARAAAGACWKRSVAAPPARDRRGRRRQLGSRMLIWERRGHARDRRLGGLLYGLFGGMGGGGEENGGLHGAIVLQQERRATCRSHVLNLLAYREGSARRGASPGSARRDLSAGTVGLSLPSCTSALARADADSFPEASRRGTRRQENSETRHRSYHTTRTTQRGRAALPPGCRISAARKPSPRSRAWTRGSPSRGRRRCPSSKMRRGASRRSRVKPR